ncbi:MAG: aminopeptidase P family protein [Spirochaetes bacterium]|nr:aminopeptidase P family protein [Spirochaetota bacterium]
MRLKKLQTNLIKSKKFPYLISNLTNIKYLTGFGGTYANIVIDDKQIFFITDSRYTEYASSLLPESIEIIQMTTGLPDSLKDILKTVKKKRLYIDYSIPLSGYQSLNNNLGKIKLIPGADEIDSLRIIKDENEINTLRKAVEIADKCFAHLLKIIKPGILEWDIAVEIEYFYRKNGCTKSSFDSIVASGKGSSMPHYITSMSKKIRHGDILLIDMGCTFNGYNSDLTRTVFAGSIEPEFEKIYNIVRTAQEKAISSVKPGITTGKLDGIARDVIAGSGYGREFGHSLGHGIGLEVHESPAIKGGSTFRLKKNIPFTVEPGIYIPEKGGIRIEDVVIVTENGFEDLTQASKEIIIL